MTNGTDPLCTPLNGGVYHENGTDKYYLAIIHKRCFDLIDLTFCTSTSFTGRFGYFIELLRQGEYSFVGLFDDIYKKEEQND